VEDRADKNRERLPLGRIGEPSPTVEVGALRESASRYFRRGHTDSFCLRCFPFGSFSAGGRLKTTPIRIIGKLHRDLYTVPSLPGSPRTPSPRGPDSHTGCTFSVSLQRKCSLRNLGDSLIEQENKAGLNPEP
jgi:hypothetical protein